MEGDRNTKFFHVSIIIRRKRNKIDRLKIDGDWCDDPDLISNHNINYYNHLFASHNNSDIIDIPHIPILQIEITVFLPAHFHGMKLRKQFLG